MKKIIKDWLKYMWNTLVWKLIQAAWRAFRCFLREAAKIIREWFGL